MTKILNVTPATGEWYAMMKDENDPGGQPHAVRIAVWATISTPAVKMGDNETPDEVEVVAMIPDDYAAGTLSFLTDQCLGIADAESARSTHWTDAAKEALKVSILEEHQEVTDETIQKRLKEIASNPWGKEKDVFELLVAIKKNLPYYLNTPILHALYEKDFLRSIDGGYHFTSLGDRLLKQLRMSGFR